MSDAIVKPNARLGIFVAIAASIVYSIYPAACRGAYADGANPVFMVFVTNFIRTLMLVAFCLFTGKKLFVSRYAKKVAVTGGLWQALSVVCVVTSLALIPGPIVIIILFTHTMLLLLFMAWRREIVLDAMTLTTTLFALIGLVFVLDVTSTDTSLNWVGVALAFVASIATFGRIYVYGKQMSERHPALVGAETFLVVSVILPFLMLWNLPVPPHGLAGHGWAILAGLSLGLGSFGTFYGIAMLGSFRLSLFMKIEPIFTSLFSVLLIGEYLKDSQYMGILVVVGSLIVYQVLSQRKAIRKTMAPVAQSE